MEQKEGKGKGFGGFQEELMEEGMPPQVLVGPLWEGSDGTQKLQSHFMSAASGCLEAPPL